MSQVPSTPPTPSVPRWLQGLVRLLDDALPIPGTRLRVGLDAIVGFLLPGSGDAVTGLSHVALLWAAFRAGVPPVVMARMLLNIAIDVGVGLIPLLGDGFDLVFKANRKNLELLERNRSPERFEATAGDYLMVGGAILCTLLLLSLPLIVFTLLVRALF